MKRIIEKMDALTSVSDVKIIVGEGTVCSDWHFDGWAVRVWGIWMWREDLGKWFFKGENDPTWWMVLGADEVTFE